MRIVVIALAWLWAVAPAAGQKVRAPARAWPYTVDDRTGNQWMVYQQGWLQQRGNQPIYSQGGMLMINGAAPNPSGQPARLDPDTGELIVDGLSAGGVQVTRRMKFFTDEGYVRVIDVLSVDGAGADLNVMLQSALNFGVQSAEFVADAKRGDRRIGWVATTPVGRSAIELFAGPGAEAAPTIEWHEGNNMVQASLPLRLEPRRPRALLHVHGVAPAGPEAVKAASAILASRLTADLPPDLRRMIVNFRVADMLVGDLEVLRGEALDVVELRGGDQLRGTLRDASWPVLTDYGRIDLPGEQFLAMLTVGQFQPRRLLVSAAGEVIGGRLERETASLELSSGQVLTIPLSQVTRIGRRRGAEEPESPPFASPLLLLRGGDRIAVAPGGAPLGLQTRYGRVDLPVESLAQATLDGPDLPVHEVILRDGSRLSGLLLGESIDWPRRGGGPLRVPVSALRGLQFVAETPEIAPDAARATFGQGDVLAGELAGTLRLRTAFDDLAIEGAEVASMARLEGGPFDVRVTLWDGTAVSGRLADDEVTLRLAGLTIAAPAPLLTEYVNPLPRPSAPTVERVAALVARLGDSDWKQRDAAQAELAGLGRIALPLLREARQRPQSPEAAQRLDTLIAELEASR